jgi:hypothetical protein
MVAERRDTGMEILNRRPEFTGYAIFRRKMIPDRDIWRAANLLIREHGDGAEFVAARRADEMLDRGDLEGEAVWLRIRRAIVELQAVSVGRPN